jgi:hypothetical protein
MSRAWTYVWPVKLDNLTSKEITVVRRCSMEVSHAPTGCMLIKREVFEKMIKELILNDKIESSNYYKW